MFPVTDEAALPVEEDRARTSARPTGETVLIVEDEEALREVTERIFTRSGYQVLTAADGHEAIAIAAGYDGDIHLLVTDVVMPNMLGKEVAERIRRPQARHRGALHVRLRPARPGLAGRLDRDVHLIEKPFSASAIIEKAGQLLLYLDPSDPGRLRLDGRNAHCRPTPV